MKFSLGVSQTLELERELFFERDKLGRPLGESKIPFEYRSEVPLELTTCPYRDSRSGSQKPMNRSALIGIISHWPEILASIAYVRTFLSEPGCEENSVSILTLSRLCESVAALPLLLRIQNNYRPNLNLSAIVAGAFKTMIGPRGLVRDLTEVLSLNDNLELDSELSSEVLWNYIESSGSLIGPKEVCAGPPHLVRELVEVICGKIPKNMNGFAVELGDSIVPSLLGLGDWARICYMSRRIFCVGLIRSKPEILGKQSVEVASLLATANLQMESCQGENGIWLEARMRGLLSSKCRALWEVKGDDRLGRSAEQISKILRHAISMPVMKIETLDSIIALDNAPENGVDSRDSYFAITGNTRHQLLNLLKDET